MKLFNLLFGPAEPLHVEYTTAPADVVPLADLFPGETIHLDDTPEAAELERDARTRHMLRHIHRTLLLESLKDPAVRCTALVDFCLDARSILQPAPADAVVLREATPERVS